MKLTLKIAIALTVLTAALAAYAEVPDVLKWSCQNAVVGNFPNYGVEAVSCEPDSSGNLYVKVSGELIYVHEHRKDADGKNVYYNALKTNEGKWMEVTNSKDVLYNFEIKENGDTLLMILDDNNNIIAKMLVPLLKK